VLGPILGGGICDKAGFILTVDSMAIASLLFAVFNAIVCIDIQLRKTQTTKKRDFPDIEKKPLLPSDSHFIIGD
jgi:hypothetical protein